MRACIEVLSGGLGSTLQDQGRFGQRRCGVPWSGFLDPPLAHAANVLVGNQATTSCIELRVAGPTLRVVHGIVWFAMAGSVYATLSRASGLQESIPAWQSVMLGAGDSLQVGVVSDGCAYLAISGGVDVLPDMGSRATYASIGLGGINGTALAAGDQWWTQVFDDCAQRNLKASQAWSSLDERALTGEWQVRVMLGPQDDCFTDKALADLCSNKWLTSAAQDRMGVRLLGQPLQHKAGADVVSDGIAPGAIQVPASGEPIVLLADCQTMGGYTKIATVVSADLAKMAHMPAGAALRFEALSAQQARAALLARHQQWQQWLACVRPFVPAGWLDKTALASANLISGVVRASNTATESE